MFKALCCLLMLVLLSYAVPSVAHGSFVYVSNYGDGTISQFRASPNGTLTPLNPPTVKAYSRCHSLAADPNGRFLYALSGLEFSRRNCLISQYRIKANGGLTPLLPLHIPLPLSAAPYLLFTEPKGRFLYVLERGGACVCFRISTSGNLRLLDLPIQSVGLSGNSHFSLAYDQTHSTFYAAGETRMTNMYLAEKSAFRIAQNGHLRSVNPSPFHKQSLNSNRYDDQNAYVQQVVTAHRGHSVYYLFCWLASIGNGPALIQYRTQLNLGLVPLKPAVRFFSACPAEVFVDPSSHYFYALNSQPLNSKNTVKVGNVVLERYAALTNGLLGQKSQQLLVGQGNLFGPVFDPSGRFLYLLTGNGVHPFRVEHNGSVVPLTAGSIRAGRGPLEMVYIRH